MYRTASSLPKLAPPASLWRRLRAWSRGTFRKLERRAERQEAMRRLKESGRYGSGGESLLPEPLQHLGRPRPPMV